jgi:tetratricopeptide (TPR) repeat protein
MKRNLDILFVLLVTTGILLSQDRFDYKVRNYFFAAFSGDTVSLDKGMKICEDLLAADSKNAPALVWHGAGLFFKSGQSFRSGNQKTGMDLWQRGLKEMDDAASIAPDDLQVRIPRGAVLLTASRTVPSADLARPLIEKGVADYEKAYSIQGPDLSGLGTHPRGELLIGLADGYSRLGNQEKAQQWFERIHQELPGTPYDKSAQTWLETKTLAPAQGGCLGCHTGK